MPHAWERETYTPPSKNFTKDGWRCKNCLKWIFFEDDRTPTPDHLVWVDGFKVSCEERIIWMVHAS